MPVSVSLSELLATKTADQVLQLMLDALVGRGFVTNDWSSGGFERTLLEVEALSQSDLWLALSDLAKGGYGEFAEGNFLDLWGQDTFSLERKPALNNTRLLRLTCASFAGPYTIIPNQLWAGNQASGGLRWQNTTGGLLNPSSTLDLEFIAEFAGSQYNVATNTINFLLTPLPGVTVTNLSGTVLVAGVDAESDANYRERIRLQWAKLSVGRIADYYRSVALDSDATITKCVVLDQHPRGPNSADVVIAGETSLSPTVISNADDVIQEVRAIGADILTYEATDLPVARTYSIDVIAGNLVSVQDAHNASIAQLNAELQIGGTLFHARIIEALMVTGVRNVVAVTSSADINPADAEIIRPTFTLSYTET